MNHPASAPRSSASGRSACWRSNSCCSEGEDAGARGQPALEVLRTLVESPGTLVSKRD
jgi:hypothetical protein